MPDIKLPEEADIVINGVKVTYAMAMTIRCAINNFAMDLQENGLGDDEHGKFMTNSYLQNIKELNKLIIG